MTSEKRELCQWKGINYAMLNSNGKTVVKTDLNEGLVSDDHEKSDHEFQKSFQYVSPDDQKRKLVEALELEERVPP